MRNQKLIYSAFFLLITFYVNAQKDLPTDQVNVIKNFEARLIETDKLDIKPVLPPVDTNSVARNMKYNIQDKQTEIDYQAPKLKPISMKADALPPSFDGYGKLGYGTQKMPYLDASYYYKKDKTIEVGGNIFYQSANNTSNFENQRFDKFKFGLDGSYLTESNIGVKAKFGYDGRGYSFYGYDHEKYSFSADSTKQKFNAFDLGAQLFSVNKTDSDLSFNGGLDFYSYNDIAKSKETGIGLNVSATKWFSEKHPLNLTIRSNRVGFKDTSSQSLTNIWLQPSFEYHAELFSVKVGVNMVSHASNFYFYPDVQAVLNLTGNSLMLFAGAKGDLQQNSFRTLSTYSPFILSNVNIRNTNYLDFYGGIKGNMDMFDYQIQAGFKKAKDLPLFLNDTLPTRFNRLAVVYDTVNNTYIKGTLNIRPMAGLTIGGQLAFNIFDTKNQPTAWHLPALEGNATIRYTTLSDKLILKGNLFFANGPNGRNNLNETVRLNPLIDLSVGAEYWFVKNIGAFVDVNNILNNKRERWYGYPSFGFNALAGVVARF